MGRHRGRSRSCSPRRGNGDRSSGQQQERHREERGQKSEKPRRRHDDSPGRNGRLYGGSRHRSPDARQGGGSPPRRHRSSERRHDGGREEGRPRGGSSERGNPPLPPAERVRDWDREKLPPPPEDGKPSKRRSRFDQSPDAAQLNEALPPPPQQQASPPDEPVEEEAAEPEPDFALSGKLAAESNKVNGVVLLHAEPQEAANPQHRWRLYQFKGGKPFQDPLPIHRQSCYLFGRERRVADVPTDHPSCSKQHAVLQFRRTEKEGADGLMHANVRPYLMDLGSVNGTFLNNERVEGERYYELLEQDMVRFGNSTREYVLLHEGSSI